MSAHYICPYVRTLLRTLPRERLSWVSPLQRFDLDDSKTIDDVELNRRWTAFHRSTRSTSSNPIRRIGGALLKEDSARYRAVRRVVSPWLGRDHVKATSPGSDPHSMRDETSAFPTNFIMDQDPPSPPSLPRETRREVLVLVLDENHAECDTIVENLNLSLRATEATWIMLVDSSTTGDERDIALRALLARADAGIDVVYADETGPISVQPVLKPAAIGPHTLLSYNVVGRPALIRTTTLLSIEGFRRDAGWAFEHDAYLRILENGGRFVHVAKVLPAGRPDVAFHAEHIDVATLHATSSALARRGWKGSVDVATVTGVSHWRLDVPSPAPSIDVVMPTRDRIDLVRRCLQSIERSTYPNYDVIIVDNDSVEPESIEFFNTTQYRVVRSPGAFNYAKIVNQGVEHSTADFVITLNNDTFVLSADWLEQMVALASLDDVGVVGVCLLDRTGAHEHDGFVISPYPQHLRMGSNYPLQDQYTAATRDVIAVTGAAQMVNRLFWKQLGGMDEQLRVVMNDVDLCLRSQLNGRHVVFCPDVQIFHYAGSSRGSLDPIEDRNRFIRRWDIFGTFEDPYVPESIDLYGNSFIYRYR